MKTVLANLLNKRLEQLYEQYYAARGEYIALEKQQTQIEQDMAAIKKALSVQSERTAAPHGNVIKQGGGRY